MAEKDKFASEIMSEEELKEVNGGSFKVTENEAKEAGLTLINDDGTDGSFGFLWNTGNYHCRGKRISNDDAYHIVFYVKKNNCQPESLEEANKYYKENHSRKFAIRLK